MFWRRGRILHDVKGGLAFLTMFFFMLHKGINQQQQNKSSNPNVAAWHHHNYHHHHHRRRQKVTRPRFYIYFGSIKQLFNPSSRVLTNQTKSSRCYYCLSKKTSIHVDLVLTLSDIVILFGSMVMYSFDSSSHSSYKQFSMLSGLLFLSFISIL